jgi:hypothetical protein
MRWLLNAIIISQLKICHSGYSLVKISNSKLIMVSDRFGEILQKWQKLKEKYTQLKTDNSLKYLSWSPKQAKIFGVHIGV